MRWQIICDSPIFKQRNSDQVTFLAIMTIRTYSGHWPVCQWCPPKQPTIILQWNDEKSILLVLNNDMGQLEKCAC